MSDMSSSLAIRGIPISPGLVQGPIHVHRGLLGPIDAPVDIEKNNVNDEFSRLDKATALVTAWAITLVTGNDRIVSGYGGRGKQNLITALNGIIQAARLGAGDMLNVR